MKDSLRRPVVSKMPTQQNAHTCAVWAVVQHPDQTNSVMHVPLYIESNATSSTLQEVLQFPLLIYSPIVTNFTIVVT